MPRLGRAQPFAWKQRPALHPAAAVAATGRSFGIIINYLVVLLPFVYAAGQRVV